LPGHTNPLESNETHPLGLALRIACNTPRSLAFAPLSLSLTALAGAPSSGTRLLPSQFCFPILLQKSVEAPGDKIMQIENDYDKEV